MHTITMLLERETKGALRYRGVGNDSPDDPHYIIGTMYLRKTGTEHYVIEDGADWPRQIKVTVEVVD